MNMVKRSSKMKGIFAVFFSLMLTLAMMPGLPFGGDAVYAATNYSFNVNDGNVTIEDDGTSNVKVTQAGHDQTGIVPESSTITLTGTTTANIVSVTTKHSITIILKNLSIDVHSDSNKCAFSIAGTGTMTNRTINIKLVGTNVLSSGYYRAGLEKNGDQAASGSLVINDDEATDGIGKLTANGGLGGGNSKSGENITISGGSITANGGYGAGIGGGSSGSGNNITISGGSVTAESAGGAGIGGGGYGGTSGNITISGGSVMASTVPYKTIGNLVCVASSTGAAIGGGRGGTASNIVISGGTVIAKTIRTATSGGQTHTAIKTGAAIGGGAIDDNNLASGGSLSSGNNGHAWIIADSGNSEDINSALGEFNSGVIFTGATGKVYGTPTIQTDEEVPSGSTLTVGNQKGITIGSGVTLTNNGTITNNGTVTNNGAFKSSSLITNAGKYTGKFTLLFGTGSTQEETLDPNGSNLNFADMSIVNNGTGLKLASMNRGGYYLGGWSDGTTTYGSTGTATLTNGKTLTAQWIYIPPIYSVTLNGNDGAGTTLTTYTSGTGATLPTDWTKDGYTFEGWYDNADLTGTAVTAITATDSGNKEYFAKWTKNPDPVPATPTGVKAAASGKTSIKVSWNQADRATSYKVYKASSKTGKYYFVGSAKDDDLTVKNLKANKTYYFKVKSLNSSGSSEFSKAASARIKVKKNSVKFALKNIKGNNIRVTWNKVKGARGYQVANNATTSGKLKIQWTAGSNARTYFSMNKTKGKTYKFKMRYFKVKDGKKVYSSWTSVKTIKVD